MPETPSPKSLAALVAAGTPLLAAAVAAPLAAASGFTRTSLAGTAAEDLLYGYFARSQPLFALAIAYGTARIVAAAVVGPAAGPAWRSLAALPAVLLFLLACLYPTFGGIVLRAGFMSGAISFLGGMSEVASSVLGAGAAALVFAAALGLGRAVAGLRVRISRRTLGLGFLRWLALWLGAVLALGATRLGFDAAGWPDRPLPLAQAWQAAAIAVLAFLPHALIDGRAGRGDPAAPRGNVPAAQALP